MPDLVAVDPLMALRELNGSPIVEDSLPLPAVAPSSVASTTPSSDPKAFARERTRRRLDEIHANLERERLAKAAVVVAPSTQPPAPLIANPRRDPIPAFLLAPRGRNRKVDKGHHEYSSAQPGIELPEVDSSKRCPWFVVIFRPSHISLSDPFWLTCNILCYSGQVFSRRDHVTRHRARNICSAGLLYAGEPKRSTAKGATANASSRPSDGVVLPVRQSSIASSSQIDPPTLPLHLDDDGSSLTSDDESKAGSDYGSKQKGKAPAAAGAPARGKVNYHHCTWCVCPLAARRGLPLHILIFRSLFHSGLSFNHIGNFNRHRKARKCSAVLPSGAAVVQEQPRTPTPAPAPAPLPAVPIVIPEGSVVHDRPLTRKEFPSKEATVCAW